ncbi:DUF1801 domain-containing protein [Massilia sp. CF038]|uniref:DUF1801 domain-containing protein n=1 Tax=Massilia sp. CF038 TaxID=1881045 RepID=UPI00091CD9F0|nr:DUF1801 domain-containing protein [Massilia sp. CF038]SHG76725.1 hypothetical protein SAMN05428948_1949 [Massilia sp. CF038]
MTVADLADSMPPGAFIDQKIARLGDWRGAALSEVRKLIHDALPEVVEEVKWMGTPVWSSNGIICTGETYKAAVKLTFLKGAAVSDPAGLFNASLDGNARRAIDLHEGERLDPAAFKALIQAAAALNVKPARKRAAKKAS